MSDAPSVRVGDGVRDPVTGRWLPGHPGGPGRPRKPDLFAVALEGAAREGVDLRASLWAVLQAIVQRALTGDVSAAKLVLDRLTDPDPIVVEHTGTVTDADAARQIQALLATAAARKEQGADKPAG